MEAVTALVAFALLLFGRQLYWLFVGAIGFLLGMHFGSELLAGQPEWMVLLAAVLVGVVGAVLAVVLQRVAVGIAGFLAGGYFALALLAPLGIDPGAAGTIAFVIGGVIAGILAVVFLDPALIGISALLGAATIAQGGWVPPGMQAIAFAGLLILGVAVQWAMLYGQRRRQRV